MDALAAFLARYQPHSEEVAVWGPHQFQVASYLCVDMPPDALIISVRAIVCDGRRLLVVRDPDSIHIMPGGRREPGETLEQTLRREVLEETGWQIDSPSLLGFKHFHHLTPKPPGYPYPYPDFLQLIYRARPKQYVAGARHIDSYELAAMLVPLNQKDALPLSASERIFLAAAVNAQPRSSARTVTPGFG